MEPDGQHGLIFAGSLYLHMIRLVQDVYYPLLYFLPSVHRQGVYTDKFLKYGSVAV